MRGDAYGVVGCLDHISNLAQKYSIWVGIISDKHNRIISDKR